MSKAERLIAWGLILLAFSAGLLQFVIIGLIGILVFVVAIGILLIGGVMARGAGVSSNRAISGSLFFVAGLILLAWAAAKSSWLGFLIVYEAGHPGQPVPSVNDWVVTVILIIVSALTISSALHLKSVCALQRCRIWAVAILLVCPVAFLEFLLLSRFLPIGT
jgi:hypothetical protein